MTLRGRNLGQLRWNIQQLPLQISCWKKRGELEKVQMGEAILKASLAEIERRQKG